MYLVLYFFFFNDTATTEIYTLSLHDALPISSSTCSSTIGVYAVTVTLKPNHSPNDVWIIRSPPFAGCGLFKLRRSEEHTSELQSRQYLVCRLLLEKKKKSSKFNAIMLDTNRK